VKYVNTSDVKVAKLLKWAFPCCIKLQFANNKPVVLFYFLKVDNELQMSHIPFLLINNLSFMFKKKRQLKIGPEENCTNEQSLDKGL
jgi:hypothetical protein